MKKGTLFKYLAAASGYIGIGLVLGYVLSDQVSNTPLWVGGLLIVLGAILLGMTISSGAAVTNKPDARPSQDNRPGLSAIPSERTSQPADTDTRP